MFKRFSLQKKLLALCFLLSGLAVTTGITGLVSTETVIRVYDQVASDALPHIQTTYDMYLNYRKVRINLRTLAIPGLSAEEAQEAIAQVKEAIAAVEEDDKKFRARSFAASEKELYEAVWTQWTHFKGIGAKVLELHAMNTPDAKEKIIQIFLKDCPDAARNFTVAINRFLEFNEKEADLWVAEAKEHSARAEKLIVAILALGVFAGLTLGWFFSKAISRAVLEISESLRMGAGEVTSASTQISGSSASLAQAASEQAASMQETVATMEELSSMIQVNTQNAQQASKLSGETCEVAAKGEKEIQALISSIQEIAADSRKIEDIINVIDDIAFQTNLLALNAAVEAARAGEQGKGFAVVSEAVRNLAQRSSVAAKDISVLIQGSVAKIQDGRLKAEHGGKVLNEIVQSVTKVAHLNQEIAVASNEQSRGVSQIGQAMNQLDQVTQQNASAAEEAAATSEELSAQSHSLSANVERLKAIVEGEGAAGSREYGPKEDSSPKLSKPFSKAA